MSCLPLQTLQLLSLWLWLPRSPLLCLFLLPNNSRRPWLRRFLSRWQLQWISPLSSEMLLRSEHRLSFSLLFVHRVEFYRSSSRVTSLFLIDLFSLASLFLLFVCDFQDHLLPSFQRIIQNTFVQIAEAFDATLKEQIIQMQTQITQSLTQTVTQSLTQTTQTLTQTLAAAASAQTSSLKKQLQDLDLSTNPTLLQLSESIWD